MASTLYIAPYIPAFSPIGNLVPGAKLYFYKTGTNTLATIYSDAALTTPLSNPVTADLAARFPAIYLDSNVTYRIKVTDAAGISIGADIDPYLPGIGGGSEGSGDTVSTESYYVKDYVTNPDGTSDNTTAFQQCINEAPEGAVIECEAGKTYRINPNANPVFHLYGGLHLKKNQTLKLNGANLKALVSPGAESSVISQYKVDGWSILGPGRITGERNIHTGSGGEFGHGVAAFNCNGFFIGGGLEVTACWGDGLYFGSSYTGNTNDGTFCTNFRVDGVHIWDIRRNGMSPVAVKNSVITNFIIHDVNGTAPAGGIDYEPDDPAHYNDNNICSNGMIWAVETAIYLPVGNRNMLISGNKLTGNNAAIITQDNAMDIKISGNQMTSLGGSEGAAFRSLGSNIKRVSVTDNDMYDGSQFVVETLANHGVSVTNNRIYANKAGMAGFARMLGGDVFANNICVMAAAAGINGVQFLQLNVGSYGRNTYSYLGTTTVANAILAGADLGGDTYLSPLLKRPDGSSGSVGRVASRGAIAGQGLAAGGTTSFDVSGDTTSQVLIVTAWGDGANGADFAAVGYKIDKPSSSKWTVTLKNQATAGQIVSAYYITV